MYKKLHIILYITCLNNIEKRVNIMYTLISTYTFVEPLSVYEK